MQIAVIADSGEVIDSIDVDRDQMKRVLSGHYSARAQLALDLDTGPVRKFLGMHVKVDQR